MNLHDDIASLITNDTLRLAIMLLTYAVGGKTPPITFMTHYNMWRIGIDMLSRGEYYG